MNAILTREEILQSGIHHGTAALDYSYCGWKAGWRAGVSTDIFVLFFRFFLLSL